MEYNSLLSSIPKEWKRLLRHANKIDNIEETIVVKLNKIPKSIFEIETRDVYWELIGRVCQRPSTITKWEEIYDLLHFDWENILCIPFHVARETSLQSFQYKIVHRFFPCNEILNTWYPSQTNLCNSCNQLDTIEHYLVECKTVKIFWKQLFNWLSNAVKTDMNVSKIDIVFGIVNENNLDLLNVINFCILLAKYYIYVQKRSSKNLDLYTYQIELKNRLELEAVCCIQQNCIEKFNIMWNDILENL